MRVPGGLLRSFLVAFLSGLTLVGCHSGKPARQVTFLAALLPSEQMTYRDVLTDFSRRTGIRVRLVAQQYAQIREALEAELQAGRGEIDLVELDVYLLPILADAVQPLDTFRIDLDSLRKHVPRDAWRAGVTGKPLGLRFLPHRLNWQALFYDATVLTRPPATWEELLQVARDHPGAIGLKGAHYEGLVCDVFPFVWQAGGDVLHPDSPEVLQAMRFLVRLARFFNPSVQSYKESSILQAQEHREIILHPNWPFAVPLLKNKGLLPGRIRTAPLPRGPAGTATVLGGGYLGIPRTAPHPDLAARLLAYLTSRTTQHRLLTSLGWFPVRDDAWGHLPDSTAQAYAGFLAMRGSVRARPAIPEYPGISQVWQDGVAQILFEHRDPVAVLTEMQRKIDQILNPNKR